MRYILFSIVIFCSVSAFASAPPAPTGFHICVPWLTNYNDPQVLAVYHAVIEDFVQAQRNPVDQVYSNRHGQKRMVRIEDLNWLAGRVHAISGAPLSAQSIHEAYLTNKMIPGLYFAVKETFDHRNGAN